MTLSAAGVSCRLGAHPIADRLQCEHAARSLGLLWHGGEEAGEDTDAAGECFLCPACRPLMVVRVAPNRTTQDRLLCNSGVCFLDPIRNSDSSHFFRTNLRRNK